ncbi:hypothetical protein PanWU01x14_285210, partial [Parasponia andersonii]
MISDLNHKLSTKTDLSPKERKTTRLEREKKFSLQHINLFMIRISDFSLQHNFTKRISDFSFSKSFTILGLSPLMVKPPSSKLRFSLLPVLHIAFFPPQMTKLYDQNNIRCNNMHKC